jgi:hypothetical protein
VGDTGLLNPPKADRCHDGTGSDDRSGGRRLGLGELGDAGAPCGDRNNGEAAQVAAAPPAFLLHGRGTLGEHGQDPVVGLQSRKVLPPKHQRPLSELNDLV